MKQICPQSFAEKMHVMLCFRRKALTRAESWRGFFAQQQLFHNSSRSSEGQRDEDYKNNDICNKKPISFSSSFLQALHSRGFIHQCTDYKGMDQLFTESEGKGAPVAAYLGFDATAKSLHVGSLVQIMLLRHLQKCGHKPVVLIGGGTTKIGDPSGKDESRKLLDESDIRHNIQHISSIFGQFLSFGDGPTDAVIVNNADWLDSINYLEFLRTYGSHFSVNRMLSFESVKQRLEREQTLSFLEFNYMLLQAYDFLELFRSPHRVQVQFGGSDQWGNIVSGIEFARKVQHTQLYGLTVPLITNSSGKKMGKTASGAVWLDKSMLSEYDYWQFWRNTPDSDVEKFLYLFTEIPTEEIEMLMRNGHGSAINDVKIRLADETTRMLHGDTCLDDIHNTTKMLYSTSKTGAPGDMRSIPRIIIEPSSDNSSSVHLVDLLISAELAGSRSDAKRQILAGSIRVDDVKCTDPKECIDLPHFGGEENFVKLSAGKKKHVLVSMGASASL